MITNLASRVRTKPFGLEWRSSPAYVTAVIALGVAVDVLVYSLPVAVIPFQLGKLGYTDLSTKTGWLLFAYAIGLVFSTPPIAVLSERYNARRTPLVLGLFALQVSLVMFMLAPNYAVLCLARVLQGISSSVVWIVGVALLCDTVPEDKVGQQLGLAMTGMSIGMVAGPPVGGALYQRYGFYAPFIFGIGAAAADLIMRLLVIEIKVARRWIEPHVSSSTVPPEQADGYQLNPSLSTGANATSERLHSDFTGQAVAPSSPTAHERQLKTLPALLRMVRSPRAMTACFNTFIYGIIFSSEDPTLPLRLWNVFGFDSQMVGIIYIAAVLPTAFSGALAGWIADKHGARWIMIICQALAIPWFAVLAVKSSLPVFIVCLAFSSFFVSATVSPLMSDLAGVSRTLDGVGYAHVYGAFNLSYSAATALGPIIGSQIFDGVSNGWTVLCILWAAIMLVAVAPTFAFTGNVTSRGSTEVHIETERM